MTIPSCRPSETTAANAESLTTIHDKARLLKIGATQEPLSKHVDEVRAYGAWIAVLRAEGACRVTSVRLGSTVEGGDEAPLERTLAFTFTLAEFGVALGGIAEDAKAFRQQIHGCAECGPADLETGFRSVRDGCPAYGGEGRAS
ncbi:hypothetical protein [Azospirillum argentinense]|uniref:Uncharacterized protein n=1 Tax=Azospirillum argentinense TaxID=2970906 RepID=A0A5B0KSP8_9PROT|nr:hypothetical protein [Azospirillum argentinense]KAA1053834.1 hypothetical protein FH063_002416 [Azospirillum argentinense]